MLTLCKLKDVNMSIFNKLDYRENIKNLVQNRKKLDSSVTYQRMAEFMRIQKAYLSQVIKGHRDLSQDQLYMAMDYLDLKDHEKEFMQLSLEYERSGILTRKRELKKQLKMMQNKYSKTSEHIDVDEVDGHGHNLDSYFLDPYNMLIHMCLSVPKLKQSPKEIAHSLMIPLSKVQSSLTELERMGIITVDKGKIIIIKDGIHIPKESPLFPVWRMHLNQLAQQRVQVLAENKCYNFQATFGANQEVLDEIRSEFHKFIKKVQRLATDAKEEEVLHLSFDLFSWTESF